ncbi:MAG: hypothetical protein A2V98_13790 [Planctomycetes bacterium RBG_16_64_12]|nr:MAG: hypothetical protein A2V98_13790 [Planctomycetes bacterium RBG_16_64_12]
MTKNELNDYSVNENSGTRRRCESSVMETVTETSRAKPGPHFAAQPPRVLARVPDLDSVHPDVMDQTPDRRDGRMLSSQLSMGILAGGGALLLLAALGLPFLLGKSDTSEPESKEKLSAWQPTYPAPSAPSAPLWDGASEAAPTWQTRPDAHDSPRHDVPPTAVWNELPPSQVWTGQPEASPSSSQPQWPMPGGQPNAPTWNAPAGVESGVPSLGQTGSNAQPGTTPAAYPQAANSWNEQPQVPTWQVPQYRTAGQSQFRAEPPASYESYQASAEPYRQTQAGTNRPMAIRDDSPTGPSDYRTGQLQDRRDTYRTADTRADLPATGRADYPTVYRNTFPEASYPSAGLPSGATSPSGYGAGADQRYPEPGVARFQGGIEKPAESNVYDRNRSGTY